MNAIRYANGKYYPFSEADNLNAVKEKSTCWMCCDELIPQHDFIDALLDLFFKKQPFPGIYGHPNSHKIVEANQDDVMLIDGIHPKCLKLLFDQSTEGFRCVCTSTFKSAPDYIHDLRDRDFELLRRRECKETIIRGIKTSSSLIESIGILLGGIAIGLSTVSLGRRERLSGGETNLEVIDKKILIGAGLGIASGAGLTTWKQFKGAKVTDALGKIATLFGCMGIASTSFFTTLRINRACFVHSDSSMSAQQQTILVLFGGACAVATMIFAGVCVYKAGDAIITRRGFIMPEIAELVVCGTLARVGVEKLIESEVAGTEMVQLAALAATLGVAAKAARTSARSLKRMALWDVDVKTMRFFGVGLALVGLAGAVAMIGNTTFAEGIAVVFTMVVLSNMVGGSF